MQSTVNENKFIFCLNPFRQAGVFCGIFGVGIENVLGISLAVSEIESLDARHGGQHTDDGFVGVDIGHGPRWVGSVRMDAKLLIDEALDAGLQAVFETVFAGSDSVVNSTTSEVLIGK